MPIPGRAIPTTFECIEAIALREPRRLALVQDADSWSYQALFGDLVAIVQMLDRIGVGRGQRVAVGTSGLQAGLLLLIACENLGAVTLSFQSRNDPDREAVFGMVDWVISDEPQSCPAGVRFQPLDSAFLGELKRLSAADRAHCPRVALEPQEPQRISRTSGSSGKSKFMLLSRQAQEYWVRAGAENGGYRPETRLLLTGPLVMNAFFTRGSACLRMGAAVLALDHVAPQAHDFTHVLALPALLEDLLNRMPAGETPGRRVEVATVGGFVSSRLRERAARVLGGRIANRYGTNETCGICDDMDASGTGVVSAGVDIRIVDEADNDVPPGELGIVAVRTPAMADSYIGDEEASRSSFRNGWFYSGDWGTLVAPRVLRLAGRHDDLVNLAGFKIPALVLEDKIRTVAGVSDCAVLAVNLEDGAFNLGIALVVDAAAPRDVLMQAMIEKLRLGPVLNARVLFLESLPRMASGKLDRIALQRQFLALPPS